MGGCCSSSRKLQLQGTPMYFYYPPAAEEFESLTSQDSVATLLNSRVLIDLNLNMSIPDTFRAPPAPTPYDVDLGPLQSTGVKSSHVSLKDFGFLPNSPKKVDLSPLNVSTTNEEEDVCPTCLEEYDLEDPKIMTKCNHHFHLSCILEWQERSDTCPICDQEMIYESPCGVAINLAPGEQNHCSREAIPSS